jgi:hypothetical protein
VKDAANNNILIVRLYVDDLICTSNDLHMIHGFKVSIKKEFAMTDLEKMEYFFGIEVIQFEKGIFIHHRSMQKRY